MCCILSNSVDSLTWFMAGVFDCDCCRLWALTIGAGNGESGWEHNATGAIFTVNITLTDSGLANVYEVLSNPQLTAHCSHHYCSR